MAGRDRCVGNPRPGVWTKRAMETLEHTGDDDVSSTGEASADFSKTDKPMQGAS
jgi:hypothetical protein